MIKVNYLECWVLFFSPFAFDKLVRRRNANATKVSITGISISGPTTVDTATMGIEAKAVKAIAIASSKFLPVQ